MTPGISTEQNHLAPRMLHAKYQCIPASDSWEEEFLRFIKIVLIVSLIGPQKGPAPLFESPPPLSLVDIG